MAIKSVTLNDVQLASVYYKILIDLAKHKHCITYGELVERAKQENPDLDYVQSAIAVSTGRKLDTIRNYTKPRELPDLTSLVISKSDGECGEGFTNSFSPEEKRAEVFAFDWTNVSTDFDMYVEESVKKITPKPKITREQAIKLMSAYYKENKTTLPKDIADKREEIVGLIIELADVEEAFSSVV